MGGRRSGNTRVCCGFANCQQCRHALQTAARDMVMLLNVRLVLDADSERRRPSELHLENIRHARLLS